MIQDNKLRQKFMKLADEFLSVFGSGSGSETLNVTETNSSSILTELNTIDASINASGGGGASPVATHRSPIDFNATYTSSTTITLSNYESIASATQIVYIKKLKSDNTGETLFNLDGTVSFTLSGDVITVHGAGTPFASGDEYEVGINYQNKSYDDGLDVEKVVEQSPLWNRYTTPESLATAQDLTATQDNIGAAIDGRGYTHVGFFIHHDVNDSADVTLEIFGKIESGGTDDYTIETATASSVTLWSGTLTTNFDSYYEFDIGAMPYIQAKVIAGTVGATAGNLTISITKIWKP